MFHMMLDSDNARMLRQDPQIAMQSTASFLPFQFHVFVEFLTVVEFMIGFSSSHTAPPKSFFFTAWTSSF